MQESKLSRRAGIYCRISEDRPGTGLGVERQRQDCVELAAGHGWQVADTYIDNDVSAYLGKPRSEYRRLLADVEEGTIDAVVVWHLDRLHRQPKELESFIDLVERNGVLLASVSGEHDLATPEGRLHARILGAVARMESEHKSRRMKRAHLELAQAGKPWTHGKRQYGYASDGVTIVPHEAEVIRDCVQRILAGDSLRSLCLDLNRKGQFTSGGKPWTQRSLKRVMGSARSAGFRDHEGAGLVKGTWPAIISEQDWKRLGALFSDARHKPRGRPPRYLLSGILRCGECGQKLRAGPRSRGRSRVYICLPPPTGCHRVSITADWVEEFVTTAVVEALENPSIAIDERDGDDSVALEAMTQDRALLEELAVAYSNRKISMDEWLAARGSIEARIEGARASVVESSRTKRVQQLAREGKKLREHWPSLSTEHQRAFIERVIDHIVVKRVGMGHYKEISRLEPVWKD